MKNCLIILFIFFSICSAPLYAEQVPLLKGEVSVVPNSFFGSWRVVSKRIETDAPSKFKEKGIDLWNLSRTNNVITLCNPFNGAKAEITVKRADSKYVEFTKSGKYDKKILNDKVELYIEGDTFQGFDSLILETYVNGKLTKVETAKYSLKGEKISGQISD